MAVSIPTKPVARVEVEVGRPFSDASGGRRRRSQIGAALLTIATRCSPNSAQWRRVEPRGSHISDSIACRLPCSQARPRTQFVVPFLA